MNWRLFAVLLLLTSAIPAVAQLSSEAEFDSIARRGIAMVYNLQFEQAEKEFGILVHMKPQHPAGYFFLAMVQWWQILVDIENDTRDKEYLDALDRVVDMCDSILDRNENDLTAVFFKGGSLGFQGRLRFHRDDYLAAANAGRRALPLVQMALSLAPDNYDLLLGTGMYNYYADVIPNEYTFLKPLLLFIPPGDKKKGIEQLTIASEKAKYADIESSYFLMQVYYFYEHDYGRALAIAQKLNGRFPDNMIFHRYLGRCYVSLNDWAKVREVFSAVADRTRRGVRGYGASAEREATYYLGMEQMTRREFDAALRSFYRCDELCRGLDRKEPSGFMSMANLKIGLIYDLQGKRDLALLQYKKVLDLKNFSNSHSQAEMYLQRPYTE